MAAGSMISSCDAINTPLIFNQQMTDNKNMNKPYLKGKWKCFGKRIIMRNFPGILKGEHLNIAQLVTNGLYASVLSLVYRE